VTDEVTEDAPPRADRLDVVASRIRPHLVLGALLIWWVVYFTRLSLDIHRGMGTAGFDFGIYDQGLWLLSRFHSPFSTIMGRPLFGDHTSFVLIFLVPFYWVAPGAWILFTFQSIACAAGAIPVYLLARRTLQSSFVATILAACYLLHPALSWGNLEQFHPDVFLATSISFAIYFAVIDKRRWLYVAVILSLLVKEDVALLLLPLGLWVAWRRDRRTGLTIMGLSLGYAGLATLVIMRSLIGKPTLNGWRLPFGGFGGIFRTAIVRPGRFFDYLRADGRPFYLWQMVMPLVAGFARALDLAGIAVLVLASNIISTFGYQHIIHFHYSVAPVPVLALAAVAGIGRLAPGWRRTAVIIGVALTSLWGALLWGQLPFARDLPLRWHTNTPEAVDARAVARLIPTNAKLSAFPTYVPHVDRRVFVYQFPTPFEATFWGVFDQEGSRLPVADQIEYVFLPVDLEARFVPVWDSVKDEFVLDQQIGAAALYRRKDPPPRAP
jgi:uncharacterized membrane protein